MERTMSFPSSRRTRVLRIATILIMAGLAATCQLDPGSKPDTFSFPNLADSLTRYDSTYIILKDDKGNPIDTLFRSRVLSSGDLERLEAPHFKGGKTRITIIGFEGKQEVYHVDRSYDPVHQHVDSVSVRATPFSSIRLAFKELEIPVKTLVPYPSVAVEPEQLLEKEYAWASDQEKLVRVEAGGLRGLGVGSARVVVSLASDPGKKDTLTVSVTARPALPDSIRLHPDTLVVAAGGRPMPLTLESFPSGASKKVEWNLSNSNLATISQDGSVHGLAKGLVTAKAISEEDSDITDSARIRVLDSVHVESLRFLQDSIEVFEGGTPVKLDLEVNPLLSSLEIRYQIADSAIALVQNDHVVGLKEGATNIVGISQDSPSKKDTLKAIILSRQKVDSVVAFTDTVHLYLGAPPVTLSANVFPAAAAQKVDWKSQDEILVRVDATGKATPLAVGKTTILGFARADSSKQDRMVALIRKDTPLLTLGRADTTVPKGATVLFHPKAPQEFGKVTHFEWDFDGDGTWDGNSDTLQDIPHLYSAAGDFPARFRVEDTEGNDTLVTKRVHVVVGPVILILQPPDKFQTNQKTIDVAWSVDEAEQTVQKKETLLLYGANTLTRTAKDSAGNVYSASIMVYLDTLPPARPKLNGATPVNTKTPTWTWTSGGNGGNGSYRYWMDNEDITVARSLNDTVFTPATDLNAGTHTLFIQERDDAGNWSATSHFAIVIDLTQPAPPVAAAGFVPLTNNPKPSWVWASGSSDGMGVFRYRLDNNDLSQGTTTASAFSFTASGSLPEGPHTLYLQERDSASNWSSTTPLLVRIDLTPPASPSMDSTPYSPLNTLRPTWTWKGGGGGMGVFRCEIDDADLNAGADTVNQASFKAGKDYIEGSHTLYVQERDSAGNWSKASQRSLLLSLREIVGPVVFESGEIDLSLSNFKITPQGELLVAYSELSNKRITIKRYQSGNWIPLGSPSPNGKLSSPNSFTIGPSGIPYLVVLDTLNQPTVWRFIQNQWIQVGAENFSGGPVDLVSLTISPSGVPYISYRDESIQSTTVRRFNGNNWELAGPQGFTPEIPLFTDVAATRSGTVYTAYMEANIDQNPVTVRRLTANNLHWELLPDFPVHSAGNHQFYLVAKEDSVFIALVSDLSKSIEVYKLNGNKWERIGEPISTTLIYNNLSFCISPSGNLFVSYRDESNGNRISVKTFKNSDWIPVGTVGFSPEASWEYNGSFVQVGQNEIPYVLFIDATNRNRATVIKTSFDP
jgi:hypothetical protein